MSSLQGDPLADVDRWVPPEGPGLVYLYCVQPAGTGQALPGARRLGTGLTRVRIGALEALVEPVSPGEFCQDNLADAAWTLARLPIHEEVVEQAMVSGALLPSRFGTLFSSFEAVRRRLERDEPRLVCLLEELKGTEEWGLDTLARSVPMATVGSISQPGGLAFLRSKQRVRQNESELREAGAGASDRAFDRLADLATRAVRLAEFPLKAAFLVSSDSRAAFRARVRALFRDLPAVGLEGRLSGPWPPYHFCGSIGNGVEP